MSPLRERRAHPTPVSANRRFPPDARAGRVGALEGNR